MSTPPPTRILVADDDRMMRRLLRQALEQDGYEVVEAEDGARCVAQFAALTPIWCCLTA